MVVVTRYVVFKYAYDWRMHRIFREFCLTWKAFLHGLAPPAILVGPVLIRPTIKLLKDIQVSDRDIAAIESRIEELEKIGVEHREFRHPERHIGRWRGRWVFIDFDRGRFTSRPRDKNKFRAWLRGRKLLRRNQPRLSNPP